MLVLNCIICEMEKFIHIGMKGTFEVHCSDCPKNTNLFLGSARWLGCV